MPKTSRRLDVDSIYGLSFKFDPDPTHQIKKAGKSRIKQARLPKMYLRQDRVVTNNRIPRPVYTYHRKYNEETDRTHKQDREHDGGSELMHRKITHSGHRPPLFPKAL
jgi:hypothetical protein